LKLTALYVWSEFKVTLFYILGVTN
jgi:hypothetical protein